MKTIWKFPFKIIDEEQPFDWYANEARDTVVSMQGTKLCLWQTVHLDQKPFHYVAKVVGTGDEFDDGWEHIGTGLDMEGTLVWHLLVRPKE